MDEDRSKGSHFTIPTPTQACAVVADSEGDLPMLLPSALWLCPEENEGKTVKPKHNHHVITCTSCNNNKNHLLVWFFLIFFLVTAISHLTITPAVPWLEFCQLIHCTTWKFFFIFFFTLLIYQDAIILHWSESLKWSSFWLFYSMPTAVDTVKCHPNPWAFILLC